MKSPLIKLSGDMWWVPIFIRSNKSLLSFFLTIFFKEKYLMDIAEPTATVDEGPSHELISSPSAWVGCFSSMRLSPCSRVWWHGQEPHFMPSEALLLGASLVHWKGATEIKQPQLCLTVVLKFKEETERHKKRWLGHLGEWGSLKNEWAGKLEIKIHTVHGIRKVQIWND